VLGGIAVGRFVAVGPAAPPAPAVVPADPSPADADADAGADAVAELTRRTQAAPEDARAWRDLGLAATDEAIAAGDPALYELAGRAFERATALAPDDPDTLAGRGKLALSLHRFAEAEALGRQAVAARPASPGALGVLVDAQVELGRYDQAAVTLQRLLDVRPDLAALSRAAYLRELTGDLDGAAVALLQAENAGGAPRDVATVAALRGDLALRRGDLDEAAAAYARALAADPGSLGGALGRARVAAARGDLDGAVSAAADLAARRPVPAALILHADLLRAAGRDAEASDADAVVRAGTRLQQAAGQVVDLELARFEADRGDDPQSALALARRAHAARPDNVFAAAGLGWALHRAGSPGEAADLTRQALRLGGAGAGEQARAALVLDAAGDEPAARTAARAALAESPADALAVAPELLALAERLGVDVPGAWSVLAEPAR